MIVMDETTRILARIVCFVVGAGLLLYGGVTLFLALWRKRHCQTQVRALICDMKVTSTSHKGRNRSVSYHPVYQYSVDGKTYQVTSWVRYSSQESVKVGSYETLFVDEANPRQFHCPQEHGERIQDSIFWCVLGIGGILSTFWGIAPLLVSLGVCVLMALCASFWPRKPK